MIRVIAIDGVAGSGKSTLSKSLAKSLGWAYFDTGAMYRSVAFACTSDGMDPNDETAVVAIAQNYDIHISGDPEGIDGLTHVTLNGYDISKEIRTPEVAEAVAKVAVNQKLRSVLVELQKNWIENHGDSVVEGRDIAAVVWPDSLLKIYLTADIEERARRRSDEFAEISKSEPTTKEVGDQLASRDASDSTKGGLVKVGDAIEIDTTHHTPEQTLREVLNMAEPLL